ncbi:MAG: elongation factor P maturation arginine rhamnosyltransferase EarP [Treponema sp.]|uniref:elongation factor P maturation arginine rhamnosyltransferase EarP n=1 Tax=Treponema sp. TaxID=166 RepID=UPI0025801687|nr:elongation factor P maturation arginine rhamnosyltransferase EarP [Treponema sp.]MBQ5537272.1 elongation factor P maturation arginine rhamnosyltransferase EarP [Treponema sp.]
MDKNEVMILCRAADDFGDIGIVYRLAKKLSECRPEMHLTLVVSDLGSFHEICRAVDPLKKTQDIVFNGSTWQLIAWDADIIIPPKLGIILECFHCGRPAWLEKRLFSKNFTETIQIVSIDNLTAEQYAEEFHLLKSGTRKACVHKINFMPGFTEKTGGLIIAHDAESQFARQLSVGTGKTFDILVSSYERDFTSIVKAISDFQSTTRKPVRILLANSKNHSPFMKAWTEADKPFEVEELPFLPQEQWDALIKAADFSFVRGEDSLARACLSGKPFVWHAPVQDDDYQLVKVDALLERMRRHFCGADFAILSIFWKWYNTTSAPDSDAASDNLRELLKSAAAISLADGFMNFTQSLLANGDLVNHLLDYIESLE